MVLSTGDEVRVEAFLARRWPSSMFLRSNLRRAGIEDRDEPYAGTWVGLGDPLEAVAFHGWNGIVIVQCPARVEEAAREAVGDYGVLLFA